MISRVTGEIDFRSGLRIVPHCSVLALSSVPETSLKVKGQKLPVRDWKRHALGVHESEHGDFEVEALSTDDDCVHVVLLSHRHPFYESHTPEDAERRAFHEGVVGLDLGGQKEFSWGEVVYQLDGISNRDWLVVAYNREAKVPLTGKEVLRRFWGQGNLSDEIR